MRRARRCLYGLMGLLSLLGFIGVFTPHRAFLAFFAFAVDFGYFFVKSDEMLEDYMNRSAARGFFCGMVVTALTALVRFLLDPGAPGEALLTGFSFGWAAAVAVYALSTVYYSVRESWGLEHDPQ